WTGPRRSARRRSPAPSRWPFARRGYRAWDEDALCRGLLVRSQRRHGAADFFLAAEVLGSGRLGGRGVLQHIEVVPLVGDVLLDLDDHRRAHQLVVPVAEVER